MFGFKFSAQGTAVPLLVTNKHVIDGAISIKLRLSTAHPNDLTGQAQRSGVAEYIITEGLENIILRHPDNLVDLAAIAMGPILNDLVNRGLNGFGVMFSQDDVVTPEELAELDLADPILMAGYPIGLSDYKHNLPIIRQGIIASDPMLPFNGEDHFLIDCACFPGSSGSPVVLNPSPILPDNNGQISFGRRRSALLGLLWGGPVHTSEGKIISRNIPTSTVPVPQVTQMINLGYVISAKKILDLENLFHEERPTQINFSFSHSLI